MCSQWGPRGPWHESPVGAAQALEPELGLQLPPTLSWESTGPGLPDCPVGAPAVAGTARAAIASLGVWGSCPASRGPSGRPVTHSARPRALGARSLSPIRQGESVTQKPRHWGSLCQHCHEGRPHPSLLGPGPRASSCTDRSGRAQRPVENMLPRPSRGGPPHFKSLVPQPCTAGRGHIQGTRQVGEDGGEYREG